MHAAPLQLGTCGRGEDAAVHTAGAVRCSACVWHGQQRTRCGMAFNAAPQFFFKRKKNTVHSALCTMRVRAGASATTHGLAPAGPAASEGGTRTTA